MYNPKIFSEDGLAHTLKEAISLAKSVWNLPTQPKLMNLSLLRHHYSSK